MNNQEFWEKVAKHWIKAEDGIPNIDIDVEDGFPDNWENEDSMDDELKDILADFGFDEF